MSRVTHAHGKHIVIKETGLLTWKLLFFFKLTAATCLILAEAQTGKPKICMTFMR